MGGNTSFLFIGATHPSSNAGPNPSIFRLNRALSDLGTTTSNTCDTTPSGQGSSREYSEVGPSSIEREERRNRSFDDSKAASRIAQATKPILFQHYVARLALISAIERRADTAVQNHRRRTGDSPWLRKSCAI